MPGRRRPPLGQPRLLIAGRRTDRPRWRQAAASARGRYSSVSMSASICVNASHVVYETIDGETILIHLGTGKYFSLDGVGSEVWALLAAGSSRENLLAPAADRYLGDPDDIETGLSSLLADLFREGLLVEGFAEAAAEPLGFPPGQVPFVAPVLLVYDDMQEFMLVDPLHDVDAATTWPAKID